MCAVVYLADINFVAGIHTGEDGTIISPSSAFLEITANDDPNGLLKFQDRSLDIPEDFLPGMEATTKKNLTVLRNQGTWRTVRVSSFIRHMHSIDMLTKVRFWYEAPSILLLEKVINKVVGDVETIESFRSEFTANL